MLATGGTLTWAVHILKQRGAEKIRVVGLIASTPGLVKFHRSHPDVPVYIAAVDPELDDRGYIVPGLGDAGDRYFGT